MKKGQQIRNVSDVSTDITMGKVYTLTSDASEDTVYFKDNVGCSRMRLRRSYELVQPEDDKVLVFLKNLAKALQPAAVGSWERMKYSMVLELLTEHYGLYVKVTPQVEFLPLNG